MVAFELPTLCAAIGSRRAAGRRLDNGGTNPLRNKICRLVQGNLLPRQIARLAPIAIFGPGATSERFHICGRVAGEAGRTSARSSGHGRHAEVVGQRAVRNTTVAPTTLPVPELRTATRHARSHQALGPHPIVVLHPPQDPGRHRQLLLERVARSSTPHSASPVGATDASPHVECALTVHSRCQRARRCR